MRAAREQVVPDDFTQDGAAIQADLRIGIPAATASVTHSKGDEQQREQARSRFALAKAPTRSMRLRRELNEFERR